MCRVWKESLTSSSQYHLQSVTIRKLHELAGDILESGLQCLRVILRHVRIVFPISLRGVSIACRRGGVSDAGGGHHTRRFAFFFEIFQERLARSGFSLEVSGRGVVPPDHALVIAKGVGLGFVSGHDGAHRAS